MKQQLKILFRGELRYHLREPTTLILMFVVPLLLYPLLFWGFSAANKAQHTAFDGQTLIISAPAEFEAYVLESDYLRIELGEIPESGQPIGPDDIAAKVEGDGRNLTVHFRGKNQRSRQAHERITTVAERWQAEELKGRYDELGISSSYDDLVSLDLEDIASDSERSGNLLGGLIPLMLVFLISSGGLHTALDVFTGERDRGTLETLLTTRVDRRAILLGKFLLVLGFTTWSGLLSLLSLYLSLKMGLIEMPALQEAGLSMELSGTTIAVMAAMILPLSVQLAALLSAMSAYAPDYRTGQALALPAVLIPGALAGLAAIPQVELTALTALIPMANVSLTVREVLSGNASLGLTLLAGSATILHAIIALLAAVKMMGREAVIIGPGASGNRRARGNYLPEALGIFAVVAILFWFLGQIAQGLNISWGMAFTQIVLIALPGILGITILGLPLKETLSLKLPHPTDAVLGILGGISALGMSLLISVLQQDLIPTPTRLGEEMAKAMELDSPEWVLVFLFAVLPGICEEILFRGALLGVLKKTYKGWVRCLIVAVLFGFIHLSLPRFASTAILGFVMAMACLRSGSLLIPIIMHTLHNGLAVTGGLGLEADTPLPILMGLTAITLACVWAMGYFSSDKAKTLPAP